MSVNCSNCKIYLCEQAFVEEHENKDKSVQNKYFCSAMCQQNYINIPVKIQYAIITKKEPIEELRTKIKDLEQKLESLEKIMNTRREMINLDKDLKDFAKGDYKEDNVVVAMKKPVCGCGDCAVCMYVKQD